MGIGCKVIDEEGLPILYARKSTNILTYMRRSLHRKKRFTSFPSPAGMSLPNSP